MTHLKKYWMYYLIVAIILIAIIAYNWGSLSGWIKGLTANTTQATGSTGTGRQKCPACSENAPGFDHNGYWNPKCCNPNA